MTELCASMFADIGTGTHVPATVRHIISIVLWIFLLSAKAIIIMRQFAVDILASTASPALV